MGRCPAGRFNGRMHGANIVSRSGIISVAGQSARRVPSATAGLLSDQHRTSVIKSVTLFGGSQAVSWPVEDGILNVVDGVVE